MAYIIVVFEKENTLEVVPSDWYKNGKCIWPNKSIETRRLIEQKANPLHFEHTTFNARKLSGEILSLSEAKTKAIKATDTSNLLSIDEKTSRKIRHSYHNGQTVKQVTTKTSIPPHLSAEESIFHNKQAFIEPKQSTFAPMTDDINYKDNAAISTILSSSNVLNSSLFNNKLQDFSKSSKYIDILQMIQDTQHTILRTVLNLKYEIKEIKLQLGQLENSQIDTNNILKNQNTTISDKCSSNTQLYSIFFPIKNEEELQEFEENLKDRNFKSKLINDLTRLVRSTIGDTVRQIMGKMFHNNLLEHFSYIGQKKKRPFQCLNSNQIIFETIRKIPKFEKASDIDIMAPIKQFLAGAKFREVRKKNPQIQDVFALA